MTCKATAPKILRTTRWMWSLMVSTLEGETMPELPPCDTGRVHKAPDAEARRDARAAQGIKPGWKAQRP